MMLVLLMAFALALLALHLGSILLTLWHMRRRVPAMTDRPAITLLRPVCGLDPLDALTLGSSFTQDYPDYEVIFCAPSAGDAAVPLVRALIAQHPHVRARLLIGQDRRTGNPKLDNLWKGWTAATADWICMADSNLLLPPDYLDQLQALRGPDVGLVSSPAYGCGASGLAARLEAAFLNGNQARLQLAADALGQGFAQGKTLFWNRAFLTRAGGLAALGGKMAEDVAATRLVRDHGLKVRLSARPFAQPLGQRGLRQIWDRQLRWSRVRRDGFPLLFLFEPLNGALLPGLAVLAAAGAPAAAAFLILWYAAEWAMLARAGWPAAGRDALLLPLRDLCLPVIWAATFRQRGVTWRGTALDPVGDAQPGLTT